MIDHKEGENNANASLVGVLEGPGRGDGRYKCDNLD